MWPEYGSALESNDGNVLFNDALSSIYLWTYDNGPVG